jgi:opacity protein-like surface antigen
VGGKRTQRWLDGCFLGCLIAILVALHGSAARADEWAMDLYVGPNWPVGNPDGGEATLGGRIGYWYSLIDELDVAFYVDSGAALAEDHGVDLTTVPTSFLFMARVPLLRTDEVPAGRLQPYIGVGPSVVWSQVEKDAQDHSSTDPGLDVRGGIAWMFFQSFGVFTEYRFTYTTTQFGTFDPGNQTTDFDGTLDINHLLFGAAFRF